MEPGKAKKKKKAGKGKTKNALSQSSETAIAKIVTSVEENGWAVADNFATAEMVENARREIKVLKQAGSMKQSEIWVGQEAGVGAHVKVPEVRGDHVMWMCGGHKRHNSSSFSMNLETERDGAKVQATKSRWTKEEAGPIEPCAIRVAESVKIKQFAGLTLLLDAIDKLVVGKLSKRCARLHHVTDRTDAMVAYYPPTGSRFQKHVDNTARDGRRLTVLVYLNNGWTEEQCGQLVLHPGAENSELTGLKSGSDSRPVAVLPSGGRLAMFYADRVEHEVMPSRGERYAMTVWYYDEAESEEALVQGGKLERGLGKTSAKNSRASSDWVSHVVEGKLSVKQLQAEAAQLPEGAKAATAAIMGMAGSEEFGYNSIEAFMEAVTGMTESSRSEVAEQFRSMGR